MRAGIMSGPRGEQPGLLSEGKEWVGLDKQKMEK